jgi:small GTP-binding protein
VLSAILAASRQSLLRELRQRLGETRVALVRAGAEEEQQKALSRAIGQLDDLFMLVVVGEFNAGKSAVINALVGERVLEEGVTPTTSRIQLLRHGAERTRTQRGGDYEELTLPLPLLRDTSIVDTPGTNAVLRGHEALTREFVPRADLVLFVTSADRPFTETERTFLETIRDWGKKLVVAVNKTDILDGPEDVRKVVEFVRDKLRELLGLRPEVFAVSARQAARSKAAGAAPAPEATGFGALEAYLTRTLDDGERLRLKLASPLGVAERVLEIAADTVKARLALVAADEAALAEVEGARVQQLAELSRDLRLRVAEAEKPLLELESRGLRQLDEALRPAALPRLLGAADSAAAFRHEVSAGLAGPADRRAEGVVDALVHAELRLWSVLGERLEPRRAAHGGSVAGLPVKPRAHERARVLQALQRDCHRALEGYDARDASAQLAGEARQAAWLTLLLGASALASAGVALARAQGGSSPLPWLGAAAVLALLSLVPLPRLRARQRLRFAGSLAGLRQRFTTALRAGYERELEASQQRFEEALAPFTRHVKAEGEKLRGHLHELAGRRRELQALRGQVAALR